MGKKEPFGRICVNKNCNRYRYYLPPEVLKCPLCKKKTTEIMDYFKFWLAGWRN